MNEGERREWEDDHRHPHLRLAKAPWNHSWNPAKRPGDKIGGVILEDRIDPKTGKRFLVLDVPRRKRPVAVWVSYPELLQQIQIAAPAVGERLGITFIEEDRFGRCAYSISLPDREPSIPSRNDPDEPAGTV